MQHKLPWRYSHVTREQPSFVNILTRRKCHCLATAETHTHFLSLPLSCRCVHTHTHTHLSITCLPCYYGQGTSCDKHSRCKPVASSQCCIPPPIRPPLTHCFLKDSTCIFVDQAGSIFISHGFSPAVFMNRVETYLFIAMDHVVLLLVCVAPAVWCYRSGQVMASCEDMRPHHSGLSPQTEPAPFTIMMDHSSYRLGEEVKGKHKAYVNLKLVQCRYYIFNNMLG